MSFDLGVWCEDAPVTANAAGEKHLWFCGGVLDDAETDPRIAASQGT